MSDFSRMRKTALRLIAKNGSPAIATRVADKDKIDPITQAENQNVPLETYSFDAVGFTPGKSWQTRGNSLIGSTKTDLLFVPGDYRPITGDKIAWGGYLWAVIDFTEIAPDGGESITINLLVER